MESRPNVPNFKHTSPMSLVNFRQEIEIVLNLLIR